MSTSHGEVAPELPVSGLETSTSGQAPLAPTKRHSAFEGPIEQQQTRKLPQRKRSVFSFNGFPDIQLLDQQAIKTRLKPADQDVANQTPPLQTMAKKSPLEATSDTTKTSLPPQHQPRSDTLGSTGSSRASSCDEPPIVTDSTLLGQQASRLAANYSTQSETNTAKKQYDEQQQPRKISSTTLSATSSSSSSIDSMSSGWPTTTKSTGDMLGQQNAKEANIELTDKKNQEAAMKQQLKAEQVGSNSNKDATTNSETGNPLAFKSIKGQLKRNSIPNAQLIQQHIDNLIKHNESIVDNWNLVSIRSYNSSRDSQPAPVATSSSTNTSLATTTTTAGGVPSKRTSLLGEELQVMSASNSSKLSLPKTGSSKRWSTSLLPSGYNPPTASASICDNKKLMPPAGGLERKRSLQQLNGGFKLSSSSLLSDPLLFPKSTLNSTNLDSSTCISVPTSPKQSKSPGATYDLHLHHNIAVPSHPQQQDPVQLECAIQNLSIKRKDSEHQHPMLLMQQQHQTRNAENHITSQPFFPAPDPNLIQLNHQGQERQNIVAAAMLLERHRRSLVEQQMNFESQAALMRHQQQQQQQMIESQVEQLRLAFALEQHQQQLAACSNNGNPKQQVLTANNNNSSQANNNATKDLDQQLHHHRLHLTPCGLTTTGQHPALIDNLVVRLFEQEGLLKRQEQQQQKQQQHHLDNGKPVFRCETCDVSFWTNDLLNYHRMTQCAATRVDGNGGDNQHQPPLAFTFSGPNNFDNQELARQQYHQSIQVSKSVSPPRRSSVIEPAVLASMMIGQQYQQALIPTGRVQMGQTLAPDANLEDLSILKRQLLTVQHDATTAAVAATMVATSTVPLGSLPFKKRKISEPNMRY